MSTDILAPVPDDVDNPAKDHMGPLALISGIIAVVLSQIALYVFILNAVLAPLTTGTVVILSVALGLTILAAGLAIIAGHRVVHRKHSARTTRQGALGLIFGYGTFVVLATTIIIGLNNASTLTENLNSTTHCTQSATATVCSVE